MAAPYFVGVRVPIHAQPGNGGSTNSPDTSELRERALIRLDEEVIDLDDELAKLLAMIKMARESLQAEMVADMGYKRMATSGRILDQLKALTMIFSTATEAQTRLDKTEDLRSKKLDRSGYLKLAKKLIMSMPAGERGHWISRLVKDHRANMVAVNGNPHGASNVDRLIASLDAEIASGEASPVPVPDAQAKTPDVDNV